MGHFWSLGVRRFGRAALLACTVAAPIVISGRAFADTSAVTFGLPTLIGYNDNYWTLGYEFQANTDITVTQLGLFDAGYGVGSSNEVGLWSVDGTLLAATSVSASGTLDGYFRYSTIGPVMLTAGSDYYVAGISNNTQYTENPPNFATASEVTYLHDAFGYGPSNGGSTFPFPNQSEGLTGGPSGEGWFGANFEFTDTSSDAATTPLPSTVYAGLGLLGGLGSWMLARRRRSVAK